MPKREPIAVIGALSLLGLAACSGGGAESEAEPISTLSDPGAQLALACSGCHAAGGGAIVSLQGYTAQSLEQRLLTYKAEAEGTTVMHRLARGYSDIQIEQVSAYLGEEASE